MSVEEQNHNQTICLPYKTAQQIIIVICLTSALPNGRIVFQQYIKILCALINWSVTRFINLRILNTLIIYDGRKFGNFIHMWTSGLKSCSDVK